MRVETGNATLEPRIHQVMSAVPERERRRVGTGRPAMPAEACPDRMVREIARQCGAAELTAVWQGNDHTPQVLGSVRSAAASGVGLALFCEPAFEEPFAEGPFADQPFRLRWSGTGFTMAMPLSEGTLKLSGVLAAADRAGKDACANALEALHCFIAVFFEQWLVTRNVIGRMISFSQAIEGSGVATILLGDNAALIHANPAARAILDEEDGLRRCDDRLACSHYSDTLRLQAAMDHLRFCNAAGGTKGFNPVLAVSRAKRRALTIALTAGRQGITRDHDELCAIAYVFDPDQDLTDVLQPACRLLGLSNSETRLACALADGSSLKAAAKGMGLQEQTARSYLKQIFAKTGITRQAELVQLMLKSAVRTASGARFEVVM